MEDILLRSVELAFALILVLIGWVFKLVFRSIRKVEESQEKLNKSISEHKLHSAETFATKVDVEKGFDRVMTKLDHIEDKIDKKADKD